MSFYLKRGLVNNINIPNMAVIILLQINNDAEASCPKFHEASCHNVADCQCELSLEWLARILYQLYILLVITAASTQMWSLVFDDFFFANSYVFTASNISGSLSITRFYIRTMNRIEASAFTSFISSYFYLHDKRCLFDFSDKTSSVKNIRNHVGTVALPAARRTARRLKRLSPFIVSLGKYLATDFHFYPSAMLSITGSNSYIGARFVSNEQNTTP